ncbi:H+/Cl-antiporter ClcA [Faunimonas pinastri]|uniref:H+/Cl-antiporter ClcA n=1 Tax=Faunimonas pinastri TaxID=1855383 RepID=A0A1H9ARG0_9HYPH|nr:chloride channel protein [Faunimonas pinastri]SEP78983.1 H+/Cl-antiporter ClcA [Faunimonas pinastri]
MSSHSHSRLRRSQAIWLSRRMWQRRLVFFSGALAVGLISIAFATMARQSEAVFDRVLAISPWLALAISPIGFALSAWLCRTYFPGAQGSGIPQAIAARHFRDSRRRQALLSLKLTAGKVLLTCVGLGCGASIGREGPTVQVGASLMLQVARWGGMGRERGLILAGSAAGIAAAFNTPLAGIVFAIEEMGRAFELRTSGLVLSAVILSGLASLAIIGDYSYFGVTQAELHGFRDWAMVVVAGVGGGALGSLFSSLVLIGGTTFRRLIAPAPTFRAIMIAAACGLVVAITGLLSHGATYGTGYEQARAAVEGTGVTWYFAPLKLIATLASTLSGIPGGIFAPSLAVGAGLGGALTLAFGGSVGALAVLGMAGYFAGVVQAPITAFVIIIEMTSNHTMVIPVMISAILGYGTSRLINPEALYHTMAHAFIEDLRARAPKVEPAPEAAG